MAAHAPGTALGLDDDLLAACVGCGLCLPHCPTWRSTGEEARSPRGRIDAMRDVQLRGAPLDAGVVEVIDSCVGCRACETACPSAVQYGQLHETTAAVIASGPGPGAVPWWRRAGLALLDRPAAVRAGAVAVAVAQRLGLSGRGPLRNMPRLPLRRPGLRSTGDDVVLLTGCVMDAVQRDVHRAVVALLGAAGIGVQLQPVPGCCGALAAHAGLTELAARQLDHLVTGLPPGVTVVSDSAGCGAAIVSAAAHADAPAGVVELAARTVDVSTLLLAIAEDLPPPPAGHRPVVAVQDPCHLRHVQGAHGAVSELLGRYAEVRHTDDDGLCCGAGGSYSVLRPAEAAAIRDRKVAALRRTAAPVVASANPGCCLHLQAGGVPAEHPALVLAALLGLHGPRHTHEPQEGNDGR